MDPTKLLELENAALRVVACHESILDSVALRELLDVLRTVAPVAFAGITMPDGPGQFRTLAVSSPQLEAVIPFHARLPSPEWLYQTVTVEGRPFFARDLSNGIPMDDFAATLGVNSYAIYPIRANLETPVLAAFSIGFADVGAEQSIPPELGLTVASAITHSVQRGLEASRERRAARILDASGDAMLAWDVDGRIIDANAAAATMCGLSRDELIGTLIADLLGATPVGPSSGERFSVACRDGRSLTVSATVSPLEGDPLVTMHALLRDLSEIVSAERDAAASLAQLRQLTDQHVLLLDNAPLLIFRIDPRTEQLLYLNRHAERLFGISAALALATPHFLRDLHADADGAVAFEEAVEVAKRGEISAPYEARLELGASFGGGPEQARHSLKSRSGKNTKGHVKEAITARGTIYPILGDGGRVTAIEGILLDVTSERAARSRLVQADRLATVGMLAAGVAHEINNPAAFMLLGLDALSRQLAGVTIDSPAREIVGQLVDDLRETGRRIADIARDMRLFASPPSEEIGSPKLVDVARTIESALRITRAQIVEKADIELSLAEDLPPVAMDDGRLGQVLVNLFVNAAQAISEARLTRTIPMKGDRVRVTTRVDGSEVIIEVDDTGVGMSPHVLMRLFTPFFTTKGPDSGTGLGLAISRAILTRAGGSIEAQSPSMLTDPPRGSRFTIRLPAFLDGVVRAPAPEPSHRPSLRGRVLVVEDEPLLGRALAAQIRERHDVVLATGGEQAVDILRGAHFDAVLCDLRMPGMGGEGLYRHVLGVDPEQASRFVFMTGVGFGPDIERFLAETGVPMLEKPFPMEQALTLISQLVARTSREARADS